VAFILFENLIFPNTFYTFTIVKIKILIISSILALIVLSAFQAILLYNTYKLEEKAYTIDAISKVSGVFYSEDANKLFNKYRAELIRRLIKCDSNNIDIDLLKSQFAEDCARINKRNKPFYLRKINKYLDYNIVFKIVTKELVLNKDSLNSELLFSHLDKPIMILGYDFELKNGRLLISRVWHSKLFPNKAYPTIKLTTQVYLNIIDWQLVVIRNMVWMLIGSIIIFTLLIALLSYSIRNLIKQKKNADIRKDFIDNITHEFRTPLTTLSIATQLISTKDSVTDPDFVLNTVSIIERQNKRLQSLLNQIISRSLSDKEDVKLKLESVNISSYIHTLVSDYKVSLKDKDIQIDFSDNNCNIDKELDKFFFSIAFLNLLSNAVKYGGTIIHVQIETKNNNLELSVKDNGIGISAKYHRQIFEKFYRVKEKNKHDYKGLGLGLFYSYQIILAHGGKLSVKGKEGKGSVFLIKFSLAK